MSANAKPSAASPPSKPIELLQSQSSLLYANLHPILLLSILYFSFNNLVADPVNALITLTPTIALLQALYCILCLPSTGQTGVSPPKPGQKKKASKPAQDLWSRVVTTTLSHLLTLVLSTPLLYTTLILFGAPLTTHHPQTLLLALHLALLTTPHLFYIHGLSTQTWLHILSLQVPLDETLGLTLGALLGAWVGAVPIPLDWDREWQKWPVTVVVGMYLGAVVGKVGGGWVFKGGRVKIS